MTYRRYEFYKDRGETLAVTTCNSCRYGNYRDAWVHSKGKTKSTGITASGISLLTLITEREARKRAPKLLIEWSDTELDELGTPLASA